MKTLVVANWKCNPVTLAEAKKLFSATKKAVAIKGVECVLCPPFIYLPVLKNASVKTSARIKLGGQDCFWEDKGAFTGEISAKQLKDVGCEYVLIGHSERKKYFDETDEFANRKIKSALKNGLRPVFCVGDTLEDRKTGNIPQVLSRQIEKGLKGIKGAAVGKIILGYEPVWAIGSGKACSASEAQTINLYIRKILTKLYSAKVARNIPVLYGGSVNSNNAGSYIFEAGMSGILVGGASLNPKELAKVVKGVS